MSFIPVQDNNQLPQNDLNLPVTFAIKTNCFIMFLFHKYLVKKAIFVSVN